jgi:hypothetical protein
VTADTGREVLHLTLIARCIGGVVAAATGREQTPVRRHDSVSVR